MMHGNNNNRNRNNNNRRFSKGGGGGNNNFKKRRFGSSSGHYEDEQQISPQARRNFENKMQQHLMKAKEYLSAGERVEAENHFQHADHYYRMSVLGLDKIQQQQQQQQNQQDNGGENAEGGFETNAYEDSANAEPQGEIPEIPVELMGSFPSERQEGQRREGGNNRRDNNREGRGGGRNYNNRDNRNRNEPREPREPRAQQAAEAPASDENGLAALPFMQTPIKES